MFFHNVPLITWTDKGLYCEAGGFYIDPLRAVDVALITHAHSDHARRGHKKYITVSSGAELLQTRIGKKILVETKEYGEVFHLGDVKISFHSAGHILGSAQVRLERQGQVWVASGDYKRDFDPSCTPFEIVPCDTFITEATFGKSQFVWNKDLRHGQMIHEWWQRLATQNNNALLFGYSLGKAQRILAELASYAERPVLIHESMKELTACYRRQGINLAATRDLYEAVAELKQDETLQGQLILAPPSVLSTSWISKLGEFETAFASGWMQSGRWRNYDQGFIMSDHADWNDLHRTIQDTGAKKIFILHKSRELLNALRMKGLDAFDIEELNYDKYELRPGMNLSMGF